MDFSALPLPYWIVVGIVVLLVIARLLTTVGNTATTKGCPACLGRVEKLATKCRHCGADLPAG